jgi:hypothetical protein
MTSLQTYHTDLQQSLCFIELASLYLLIDVEYHLNVLCRIQDELTALDDEASDVGEAIVNGLYRVTTRLQTYIAHTQDADDADDEMEDEDISSDSVATFLAQTVQAFPDDTIVQAVIQNIVQWLQEELRYSCCERPYERYEMYD